MKTKYSHQWLVRADKDVVWKYFMQVLENSSRAKAWPNQIVTIKTVGQGQIRSLGRRQGSSRVSNLSGPVSSQSSRSITPHTFIESTYKIGAFKFKGPYEITQIIPGKRIAYRPQEGHSLAGFSQIDFKPAKNGTLVHWHGEYRSKGFMSAIFLLWFKFYFDGMFFSQLRKSTGAIFPLREIRRQKKVA